MSTEIMEVFDARLALLDALIAKSAALIRAKTAFRLEERSSLAFAYPMASTDRWEDMGQLAYSGSIVLPADSRWAMPTMVTGPVDPEVAFAVAVGLGES